MGDSCKILEVQKLSPGPECCHKYFSGPCLRSLRGWGPASCCSGTSERDPQPLPGWGCPVFHLPPTSPADERLLISRPQLPSSLTVYCSPCCSAFWKINSCIFKSVKGEKEILRAARDLPGSAQFLSSLAFPCLPLLPGEYLIIS